MKRTLIKLALFLLLLGGGAIVNVAVAYGHWLSIYHATDARWVEGPFTMGLPMASLESAHSRFFTEADHIPQFPIWPGFAINTAFYAAVLCLVFAVPFALRRTIRRQRGLCPACAYPIGESDCCTECGKPVKGNA